MGSWLETCAISNLPIQWNDPIRLVLLVESRPYDRRRQGGGFTYATSVWSPLGPPLKGHYDDYGRIGGVKLKNLNAHILKTFFALNVVSFKSKDDGRIKPTSSWRETLNAIERGIVRINNGEKSPSRIGQAMIHEDVYKALVKYEYEDDLTEEKISGPILREQGRAYLAKVAAHVAEDKADPEGAMLRYMQRTHRARRATFEFYLTQHEEGDSAGFGPYEDFIRRALRDDGLSVDDPSLLRLIDTIADFMQVRRLVTLGRRFWSPQAGKGRQDDDLNVHDFLADVVKKHNARFRAKWHEENIGPCPYDPYPQP